VVVMVVVVVVVVVVVGGGGGGVMAAEFPIWMAIESLSCLLVNPPSQFLKKNKKLQGQ
jgi:hypothetical protein